jgi:hypothetical protein
VIAAAALLAPSAQAAVITPRPVAPTPVTPHVVSPAPPSSSASTPAAPAPPTPPPAAAPDPPPSQSDPFPAPESDKPPTWNYTVTLQQQQILWALRIQAWEEQGAIEDVARGFLEAYWGKDGDASWGAGTNAPDAASEPAEQPGDAPATPGDNPDQDFVPPATRPTMYVPPIVATLDSALGALGELLFPNGTYQAMNGKVEDARGAADGAL